MSSTQSADNADIHTMNEIDYRTALVKEGIIESDFFFTTELDVERISDLVASRRVPFANKLKWLDRHIRERDKFLYPDFSTEIPIGRHFDRISFLEAKLEEVSDPVAPLRYAAAQNIAIISPFVIHTLMKIENEMLTKATDSFWAKDIPKLLQIESFQILATRRGGYILGEYFFGWPELVIAATVFPIRPDIIFGLSRSVFPDLIQRRRNALGYNVWDYSTIAEYVMNAIRDNVGPHLHEMENPHLALFFIKSMPTWSSPSLQGAKWQKDVFRELYEKKRFEWVFFEVSLQEDDVEQYRGYLYAPLSSTANLFEEINRITKGNNLELSDLNWADPKKNFDPIDQESIDDRLYSIHYSFIPLRFGPKFADTNSYLTLDRNTLNMLETGFLLGAIRYLYGVINKDIFRPASEAGSLSTVERVHIPCLSTTLMTVAEAFTPKGIKSLQVENEEESDEEEELNEEDEEEEEEKSEESGYYSP